MNELNGLNIQEIINLGVNGNAQIVGATYNLNNVINTNVNQS